MNIPLPLSRHNKKNKQTVKNNLYSLILKSNYWTLWLLATKTKSDLIKLDIWERRERQMFDFGS